MAERPPVDSWSIAEIAFARTLQDRDDPAVIATVVAVEGSAYRRPGAKMLLTPDGEMTGTLTAGCLRDRIVDAGLAVLDDGSARVVSFDVGDADTWDLASGCDGRIEVLLEPVADVIRDALATVADREPVTVYTAIESSDPDIDVGDRAVRSTGLAGSLPVAAVPPASEEPMVRSERVETPGGSVTVLIDPIEPAPRLLLFGSRPDLRPIAWLGRAVGFEVVVASPRGGHASPDAFPSAHDVVATHPSALPEYTDEWTYPVVLSHNAVDDQLAVEALLTSSETPYVGLLGSRDRSRLLLEAIEDDGVDLSVEQLDRLSTPVGLDLGGDGPMAVALSVVSEVFAVHHGGSGGRLRDQVGPIHDRPS